MPGKHPTYMLTGDVAVLHPACQAFNDGQQEQRQCRMPAKLSMQCNICGRDSRTE